jgi:hypothetical protein
MQATVSCCQYSIDMLAEQAACGLCSNVYLLLVEVFAVALNIVLWYQSQTTGHGVYRLMCITTKIYDIRRQYGGITELRARSALISHAHRCNTSLDTMLVSACGSFTCTTLTKQCVTQHGLFTG